MRVLPSPLRLFSKEEFMVSFSAGQETARLLLEGPQRFTCLAGGTRSGKTFLIVRAIVARAIKAKRSRHAILRFHANAARASIALDTLPNVMHLCFPRFAIKEHRQDGYFELSNGSRIWIGGLDDKERVRKNSRARICGGVRTTVHD
jgi:phage terminase large subunit